MSAVASQITNLAIVCSNVYSGADQRKHRRSALPEFVRGIHCWPVNSSHKGSIWWRHHVYFISKLQNDFGLLLLNSWIMMKACICIHIYCFLWVVIILPYSNFTMRAWISNHIPLFCEDVFSYPCPNADAGQLVIAFKRVPCRLIQSPNDLPNVAFFKKM